MKLNWSKWFYDLGNMLVRHIGTAGLTWGGITIRHRKDLDSNIWADFGVSLLCGAILPTIMNFFANRGLPETEVTVNASDSSKVTLNLPPKTDDPKP